MLRVKDVMKKEVFSVSPDDSAFSAMELMRTKKIRHLVVMEKGSLCGILSDRDIKGAITVVRVEDPRGNHFSFRDALEIRDIMTKKVMILKTDDSIHDAARLMVEKRIGALPVVDELDEGKVIGIITETDLLHVLVEELETKGEKKRENIRTLSSRR